MKQLSGRSLVGVLVSVAIVILLTIVFTVGSGSILGKKPEARPDGKGETVIGRSMYAAKDEVCRSNIGQVRQSMQIQTATVENTYPELIQDTKLGSDFYKCPVPREPYDYDKTKGTVPCVHPGHEKYSCLREP